MNTTLQSSPTPTYSPQLRAKLAEMKRRGLTLNPAETTPKDYRNPPDWFHAGQKSVWGSDAADIVACAGTQGGKTQIEPYWLLREIQRCAPLIKSLGSGKFIFAGPTLSLLRAQAIPHFKELFQEQEQLGRLVEGNQPVFRFSKDGLQKVLGFSDCPVTVSFAYAKDSSNLESMTALAGVWDEAGQKENKQESYGAYNRRLKVARSATFGSVAAFAPSWWKERYLAAEGESATFGRRLWGTTPYEWGWFKREVVDRAEAKEPGFQLFNWPSWLNPRVSETECRAELAKGAQLWRWQMMYLGLFTKPAGLIYDTFDDKLNTCDPFAVPLSWPRRPGSDFGLVNMAAVIVAEDVATETLYVIDEYLAGNKTFPDHVASIKEYTDPVTGIEKVHSLLPGAGGSHQEDGWREAFRGNGLAVGEPPVSSVEVGIGCVYGEITTRRLIIFRSCTQLLSEMQTYSRELGPDGKPLEGTIKDKASYHLLDGLRYIVSMLRPPVKVEPNTIKRSPARRSGYS